MLLGIDEIVKTEFEGSLEIPKIQKIIRRDDPFLTIMTRVCLRPKMFEICRNSIISQTLPSYHQILLVDEIKRGYEYANTAFEISLPYINIDSSWVMILDDDDMICCDTFIYELKYVSDRYPSAQIILFKGEVSNYGIFPHPFCAPFLVKGAVASFNYVIKKHLWDKYINLFGSDVIYGDFNFIDKCFNDDLNKIIWYNKLMCKTQKISAGEVE